MEYNEDCAFTGKTRRNIENHTKAEAPHREKDLVFCYTDGSRFGGTWWAKRFAAAMEVAGIDRKARNIRPHSFRHTLNSLLREKGYDPAKIPAALGLADEQIQDNYTRWNVASFDGHRKIVDGFFPK